MNPPAALSGAMSRDRKPFTYTPGGLDLSEIKSSRMAARLMRNAMNEGVPEVPKQSIPTTPPSNPVAVPNFNCLPVQVFPTFNLPANPKSLLRTRSIPNQPRDLPVQKAPPQQSQFVNNSMTSGATQYDTFNKNTPAFSQINNNRPVSMFEYGSPSQTYAPTSYGNDGYTSNLPEISYDAEYFRAPPRNYTDSVINNETIKNGSTADDISKPNIKTPFKDTYNYPDNSVDSFKPQLQEKYTILPTSDINEFDKYSENVFKHEITDKEFSLPDVGSDKQKNNFEEIYKPNIENNEVNLTIDDNIILFKNNSDPLAEESQTENNTAKSFIDPENENKSYSIDMTPVPVIDYSTFAPETKLSKPIDVFVGADDQKKEVKVVVKSKNSVENQNGSSEQNGDSEVEAVVKLPSKKSAAKTETKVEVTKKTLPDGSIEEVKKTITKTTIDGKTEIKTKTETTIIPKDDEEDEAEEVEEEEEENPEATVEEVEEEPVVTVIKKSSEENGTQNIIKTEERSETTTTTSKKVVVVQDDQEEEREEDEVVVEDNEANEEPVTFVIKQPAEKPEVAKEKEVIEEPEEEEEEEEEEEVEQPIKEDAKEKKGEEMDEKTETPAVKQEEAEEEIEEEEEYEEAEEKEITTEVAETVADSNKKKEDEEPVTTELNSEVEEGEAKEKPIEELKSETPKPIEDKEEQIQEITEEKQEVVVEKEELKQEIPVVHEVTLTQTIEASEKKVPLREPSVPLEKVEDVEIKPIGLGDFLTKTSTEKTEIITNGTDKPSGLLTEINRIENIVTVNRTTKTLDRSYEDITQQGIPTIKTYFTPHIDKISTSPQPARPYQPVYAPEPTTERRHSLLLERISVERQMPSEIYQNNYQYNNQTVEQQRQWSQEPQAEVLTVSNVKPSQITNQQWYQQRENAIYNNIAPSPQPPQTPAPSWSQPKPQTLYQPQPQYQPSPSPQPQYQAPQPQYQAPQPQYQAPQPQYQAPPQPQYQPSYSENIQEKSSNTYQNTYSTFTPKPSNWATNNNPVSPIPTIITPSQPSQYNYLNKDSTESYTKTTQQFTSSSYVPPPWEQDSTYVAPETAQNYYQAPPQTSSFSPANNKGWKPNPPTSKFSKPPPTAYIPPKPNQSFVAPVSNVEPPRLPGRKTYYSEYERRYISVPESTYIPGESKFQHQPDPSPAYYYDNNEPAETVEPQWRRELREFTEKSQSQTTTETNVRPPWEGDTKYAKAPEPTYTPTPTWSQTVRPQSWRERSFESEFVSQEWPKTNTLGRGRPLSSYGKEIIPERTRGVSVDRYNPNSYQAPVAAEHPPVQTHTHVPPAPHATGYHNPNVPAYHARASAEPREQVSYHQQPRNLREARASPFQSRSFKYLQWITGTDD